jgi:hypothetical protein
MWEEAQAEHSGRMNLTTEVFDILTVFPALNTASFTSYK